MSSPSAICTVNSIALPLTGTTGINVSAGSTITIQLANISGVNTWAINCTMSDGTNPNSAYTLIEETKEVDYTSCTATFTAPAMDGAIGAALQFTSIVNAGQWNQNAVTLGVWVLNTDGNRMFFLGEDLESNATFGITPDLNALTGASGGAPAMTPVLLNVTLDPYNADPTGVIPADTAVASAISDASATPGNGIYFPVGHYTFLSSISIPGSAGDFTVLGSGLSYTHLQCDGTFDLMDCDYSGQTFTIKNIALESAGINSGITGLSCRFLNNVIDNVYIDQFETNLRCAGNILANHLSLNDGTNGLYAGKDGGNSCNGVITNCNIGNNTIGVNVVNSTSLVLVNCFGTESNITLDLYINSSSFGTDWTNSGAYAFQDDNGGAIPSVMGPPIAAATTISPTNAYHHLQLDSGSVAIDTITEPTNRNVDDVSNLPISLTLIIDSLNISFVDTGNIMLPAGPFPMGTKITLLYDTNLALWY